MQGLSSSPPVLPIPRQPSPLSFSSVSMQDPPSPPASTSSHIISGVSLSSSPSSSRVLHPPGAQTGQTPQRKNSQSRSALAETASSSINLPIEPQQDSLLLRSTFNALDRSAATLKKLSKAVLASTSTYIALLEHVERAEDELFDHLGELGRWLESGYGLAGTSVWDDENGIRKVRKDARRREKEEMEIMVEHGIRAVKGELKRNGLAGSGAQTRFENGAKQFYSQTSEYLAPHAHAQAGPSGSSHHSQSASMQTAGSSSGDLAQASRLAQFDLARYSHHSTLLYAVPPTSITCLDLLVGLYSWTGGLLGEQFETRRPSFTRRGSQLSTGSTTPRDAEDAFGNPDAAFRLDAPANPKMLKATLSTSLARLSTIRAELLVSWAKRNAQTTELEEIASERVSEQEGSVISDLPSPKYVEMALNPSGEHKKGRKMHKLHRSVGGRLRDLLSSSGSSSNLAATEQKRPAPDRAPRASFDSHYARPEILRTIPLQVAAPNGHAGPIPPTPPSREAKDEGFKVPALPAPRNLLPVRRPSTTSPRPSLQPRHSMHETRSADYISPFIASQAVMNGTMSLESSPDLRLPDPPGDSRPLSGGVGGVGGLGAGGDEDERREEVGRKKEGVLWGAGVWEGLSKSSGKAKWENFWVVLDRSSIYEYRDNNFLRPDAAHAVIDLKFASVREGRGTDRRFVFEIVTPTQGRRLYQATSEQEMKQWLYAICNAIESCINGTSSVRTFDASKLRTASGSLDDHALPTRRLLAAPRGLGLGLPLGNAAGRRSMPPPPRPALGGASDNERRQRKTSLKKVLRQSAEIAGEKWSNVMARNSSGLDLPRPSFLGQTGRSFSKTSNEESGSTRPSSMMLPSPAYRHAGSGVAEEEDTIEQRVLEMAGLGIGGPSSRKSLDGKGSTASGRRVVSDGVSRSMTLAKLEGLPTDMSRTRSAEEGVPPVPPLPALPPKDGVRGEGGGGDGEAVDMAMLRRIADLPGNRMCADCRRGMKSSRWATLSLREYPMVMFLCIRCVGIHRSLGTHISKPRSVDLDIWTPDSIRLAAAWGNERGNAVWEEMREGKVEVNDVGVAEFIKSKYVDGIWVGRGMRERLGLGEVGGVGGGGEGRSGVGRAI